MTIKTPYGGLNWEEVKAKLASEGATNKLYDTDNDGVINLGAIPQIDRSRLPDPSAQDTHIASWIYRYGVGFVIGSPSPDHRDVSANLDLTDGAVKAIAVGDGLRIPARADFANKNGYTFEIKVGSATADSVIVKWYAGYASIIAQEAVDLSDIIYAVAANLSGSTLAFYRDDFSSAKISVTDTSYTAGAFGAGQTNGANRFPAMATIGPPMSRLPPAQRIVEIDITGSGTPEDPMRPAFRQNLVEISKLANVPDFLRREARRYELLRSKGFTDEEIELLLGHIPQHRVDTLSVTWGVVDFKPGKSSTVLAVVTGDNPYRHGAVLKQAKHAKAKGHRVLKPPRDYSEAASQHRRLRRDYPEWIAGKDSYAYHVLGHEALEPLAAADFYYGFLVDHRTRPQLDQLRRVPDWELERTLNMWMRRLEKHKPSLPPAEYEKHRRKLDEVLRLGW